MPYAQPPSLQVDMARQLFLQDGRDPGDWIAPHISRSWRRCQPLARLMSDPTPMALRQLRKRREQAMRLLACAEPELDSLTEHALGNGCVVILSDARGLILDEIGSPDFLPQAQRVALTPGVDWSERSRGTNAIGTALMERQAVMVLGHEHFLQQNGALGCAAAPIFTGRGQIAGILDISGEAIHVDSHALGLVSMAAQQVEHRMILSEASGHLLRFHPRACLLGTAREGVVVIENGRVTGINRVALALLGEDWASLLNQPVERLLGTRWGRLQQEAGAFTLPGGQEVSATVERRGHHSVSTVRPVAPRVVVPAATSQPPADDTRLPLQQAVRVLNDGVPVLVTGETGCGKEVFSRRLHAASRRSAGPFVAVNCAALPDTLIEAELFGYDEGAFTGARRRGVQGRIREAHGGVLFLDEIGDMPLALQTRLLRVLEDRVVTPLGGGQGVAVDFDLVCATHRDLRALAAEGRFRSDLLYRVNGFGVALPALRDRQDRTALILQLFEEAGGNQKKLHLHESAWARLVAYAWPGNVRELGSVLRAVVALADAGDTISAAQLPATLGGASAGSSGGAMPAAVPHSTEAAPLATMAHHAIERALADCDGNVAEAAQRLGVHRSTIYRHLARRRDG